MTWLCNFGQKYEPQILYAVEQFSLLFSRDNLK